MEREKGFEPSTLALARRCSTTELFPQKSWRGWRYRGSSPGVSRGPRHGALAGLGATRLGTGAPGRGRGRAGRSGPARRQLGLAGHGADEVVDVPPGRPEREGQRQVEE